MAFWYILWSFWYIFPVLVCRKKKNLATLLPPSDKLHKILMLTENVFTAVLLLLLHFRPGQKCFRLVLCLIFEKAFTEKIIIKGLKGF
jgi:hypothetical protein